LIITKRENLEECLEVSRLIFADGEKKRKSS